jgi:hypothetical protein
MDIKPTCKTCDYFNALGADDDGQVVGSCQRRAPVAINVATRDLDGRDIEALIPFAIWPRVYDNQRCGDHPLWSQGA